MQYIIGILAFWLDETWVMRVLVGLIAQFLSGSILPLEFYPSWLYRFPITNTWNAATHHILHHFWII